jgi:hypothetical protein
MDPEIAALAGTAGTTVVTLMAGDAWQRTRDAVVALWRRVQPDRADSVDAALEATRSDVLTARAGGDSQTEEELSSEWRGRLRRLLTADPTIAEELRRLLDEISPLIPEAAPQIRMRATASGHGRVYQAGHDQHITEA